MKRNTNDERFSTFYDFAKGPMGKEFWGRSLTHLRRRLAEFASTVDANWHSVEIAFPGCNEAWKTFFDRPSDDKDARRLEFNYQPKVTLVGPKVGHMSITDKIFDIVPEPLIAFLCMQDLLGHQNLDVSNPDHVVEIIEGRTVVIFENCVTGVVRNVQGDTFDVEGFALEGVEQLDEDQSHFTRAKFFAELEMEEPWGQATAVRYLPYLPEDGMLMDTVEAVREVRRLQAEKWQAEYDAQAPQREAEEARRREEEAAAYAALPDDERAEVDARRAAAEAQASIIHGLFGAGLIDGP